MRNFIQLIAFLTIFSSSFSIHRPTNQDDYFTLAQTSKHYVVGFYDSKKNAFGKKLIDRVLADIETQEYAKTQQLNLAAVDLPDIPIIPSHYDLKGSFAFFYYINNRLQRFEPFDQLVQDFLNQQILFSDLSSKINSWIKSKIDRINAPIKSIEEFNKIVSTQKIIAVFLGKTEGFYFNQYQEFAEMNIDFNFYHAADNFVADQIYFLKTNLPRPQTEDLFTIIRDKSLVDELDTKELVAIDAKKLTEDYEVFFQYEQYPKLRDSSFGDDIFFRLYNKNEKLVLYVYNDNSSMDEFNQFKKAVFMIPKAFIFSHINVNNEKYGSYMQMFIQGSQQPTENKVYIIHVHAGKMFIQVIPAEIDGEKITEGVNRFFKQNMLKFKKTEIAMLGGDVESQRQEEGDGELVYQEL